MQLIWRATVNTNELNLFTNKMFTTEFLSHRDHYRYGNWLNGQDNETRQLYFGVTSGPGLIENLIERIEAESDQHEILVAKNCDGWLGTLHIAKISSTQVEFGIIVHKDYRGEGIGNTLLEEAIVWARNRNYGELFMHCLGWNKPIQHLCQKHGLLPRNIQGDSEVNMHLNPPSWITIAQEVGIKQRNVYHTFLQNSKFLYQEMYG
jgi:RimJ/RimL family protein N-acetyltransferase